MLPVDLDIDGKTILTAKSENAVLDDSYKERGGIIFSKVYNKNSKQVKEKGITIYWGYTHEIRLWRDILRFDAKEIMLSNIIILSPLSLRQYKKQYQSLIKAALKYVKDIAAAAITGIKINTKKSNFSKYTIKNDPTNFSLVPALLNEVRNKWGIRVSLSMRPDYVNWRILSNPNLKYRHHFFFAGNQLVGYYLYSINNDSIANIADILFSTETVLDDMLLHFMGQAKINKGKSVDYFHNSLNNYSHHVSSRLRMLFGGNVFPNTAMCWLLKNESSNILPPIEYWLMNALWTEGFRK
jgi:hypothetical protein